MTKTAPTVTHFRSATLKSCTNRLLGSTLTCSDDLMRILAAASCYVIICRLNALTSSSGGVSGMGFTKMLDLHSSTQITVRNYFTVASQKTQLNVSTPNQDFPYTICQQKYYKCDQRKTCCLLTTRLQGSARNYSESRLTITFAQRPQNVMVCSCSF
jgi:hypothetical protein